MYEAIRGVLGFLCFYFSSMSASAVMCDSRLWHSCYALQFLLQLQYMLAVSLLRDTVMPCRWHTHIITAEECLSIPSLCVVKTAVCELSFRFVLHTPSSFSMRF